MNTSHFIAGLSIVILRLTIANACEITPINNDNVLVGDRMYSISDNTYLEASEYLNHTLNVIDKDGKETHRLSPLRITAQQERVVVDYQLEDLNLKSTSTLSVAKKGGTTCTWKDSKSSVENKLPTDQWKSDLEVLSLNYDKVSKKVAFEVRENCDLASYSLTFLDSKRERGSDHVYYKINRQSLPPGICKEDFSQTVRVITDLPSEISKPKTQITVVGAANTSAEIRLD